MKSKKELLFPEKFNELPLLKKQMQLAPIINMFLLSHTIIEEVKTFGGESKFLSSIEYSSLKKGCEVISEKYNGLYEELFNLVVDSQTDVKEQMDILNKELGNED